MLIVTGLIGLVLLVAGFCIISFGPNEFDVLGITMWFVGGVSIIVCFVMLTTAPRQCVETHNQEGFKVTTCTELKK